MGYRKAAEASMCAERMYLAWSKDEARRTPTRWSAENFADEFLARGAPLPSDAVGEIRARYLELVDPHLIGTEEEVRYIAERIYQVSSPSDCAECILRIERLLPRETSKVSIERMIDQELLPDFARDMFKRHIDGVYTAAVLVTDTLSAAS